jgi:murein L,D-transpeptidase YafK
MLGRRFFQRGHAGVATASLTPEPASLQRLALWALVAVLIGAGALAVKAWLAPGAESDVAPSAAAINTEAPSLLTSAMAKIQGDPPPSASGLVPQPISDEVLAQTLPKLGRAEARLIGVYHLIGQARPREALREAEALVRDHPNFQLAQLVLGDLLTMQTRPVGQLGDVADTKVLAAGEQLKELREQSRRRLMALTERPPEGSVPTQFLTLATQSRHAIAVDASRSRLYLFENTRASNSGEGTKPGSRMKLVADYYISVGLSGVDKLIEGDLRTPLGVYYITSSLDPNKLPDLYGAGALPINYPNALDLKRGKTGSGIWLHGSPSEQFARPPLASEGCVVLSNPDLQSLLAKVSIRTTPVVIASELHWVQPEALDLDRQQFQESLEAWRSLKSAGDLEQLKSLYSDRFTIQGQNLADWWPRVESEVKSKGSRELQIKDLSVLQWRDQDQTMVVTFGEVAEGARRGTTKRQYWIREDAQWKIFYEGPV